MAIETGRSWTGAPVVQQPTIDTMIVRTHFGKMSLHAVRRA